MNEHTRGVVALVFAALAWSTAGLFIKWLPQDAFTILCVRAIYTSLVFFAVFRWQVFRFNGRMLFTVLCYAAMVVTFVNANKLTTAANAIFLQYTGVAYVLLLEPLLLREPYRRINIVTTVVCFAGMSLFFLDGIELSVGWGVMVAALSGVAYAGFVLGQRTNDPAYHVGTIFWANLLLVLIGFPYFWEAAPFTREAHLILAFLGLVQMGLGYLLFTYGLRRTTGTEAALITMLEPLFNPIWVAIGVGELPGTLAALGGLVIISALVLRTLVLRRQRVRGVNGGGNSERFASSNPRFLPKGPAK